jgi:RIO-like serine/threonine protein kinase
VISGIISEYRGRPAIDATKNAESLVSLIEKNIFKSRRNRVWRVGDVVYKQVLPRANGPDRRAAHEAKTLMRLHGGGVYVPKLISHENGLLAMEYIEAETLADFIESAESGAPRISCDTLADRLAAWFRAFYNASAPGCIRGDINCRNFLVLPDGNIAGVDFEDMPPGDREADLGKLLAFILTYRPKYTAYKKALADMLYQKFTERFGLDPVLVSEYKERELGDMALRRRE